MRMRQRQGKDRGGNAGQLPPFDRSYWVVPGLFCAGFYPGDREPSRLREKLESLLGSGIRHVISLMEANEEDFCRRKFDPYEGTLLTMAQERGIEVTMCNYPVSDMGVPDSAVMKAILDDIDGALEHGRPVYLHCWGGLGRTGTVVGCWLARHGIARKKGVIREIARLRKGSANGDIDSPQADSQFRMVMEWRKGD
jgi:hypothetical protein